MSDDNDTLVGFLVFLVLVNVIVYTINWLAGLIVTLIVVIIVIIAIINDKEAHKKTRDQEKSDRIYRANEEAKEKEAVDFIKEKFSNGIYDEEIIEFIKPYQRVPLETIMHYMRRTHSDDWFHTGQTIPSTTNRSVLYAVKVRLEMLINERKIAGYIRPFGDVLCYIVLEPGVPPIHIGDVTIGDIGDKINVQTGDISVDVGERHYCPNCGFKTEKDWNTCPHCTTSLKNPLQDCVYCPYCGKNVQSGWKVCAYCSANLSNLTK